MGQLFMLYSDTEHSFFGRHSTAEELNVEALHIFALKNGGEVIISKKFTNKLPYTSEQFSSSRAKLLADLNHLSTV